VIEGGERTSDSVYIAMMGMDYDENGDWHDAPNCRADADFIAHAREDVPHLLSRIEALEGENEALRRDLNLAMDAKVSLYARIDALEGERERLRAELDYDPEDPDWGTKDKSRGQLRRIIRNQHKIAKGQHATIKLLSERLAAALSHTEEAGS
jgi:hypothetical protein